MNLRCFFLIPGFGVLLVFGAQAQSPNPASKAADSLPHISGTYMGLAQMDSLSPGDPLTTWYHENTMFIRNNELIYHLDPVTIRSGVKSFSA